MTHEEYLQQRNELLAKAQEAMNSNDIDAAKKIGSY